MIKVLDLLKTLEYGQKLVIRSRGYNNLPNGFLERSLIEKSDTLLAQLKRYYVVELKQQAKSKLNPCNYIEIYALRSIEITKLKKAGKFV